MKTGMNIGAGAGVWKLQVLSRYPRFARALRLVACGVVSLFAIGACGGGKPANSGGCPSGTIEKDGSCVPPETANESSAGGMASEERQEKQLAGGSSGGGGGGENASGGGAKFDKDLTYDLLKRAARQIKANCGSSTDDNGKAMGPWGGTKVSITLGRNGHVTKVDVPSPYDGKPVGKCAQNTFLGIQFPPYSGDSDKVVEWEVEFVPPAEHLK
jgi:hypothetical protein